MLRLGCKAPSAEQHCSQCGPTQRGWLPECAELEIGVVRSEARMARPRVERHLADPDAITAVVDVDANVIEPFAEPLRDRNHVCEATRPWKRALDLSCEVPVQPRPGRSVEGSVAELSVLDEYRVDHCDLSIEDEQPNLI